MDRRIIILVWIGGAILMAFVYSIGAQQFLAWCEASLVAAAHFFDDVIAMLTWRALEVTRAAAIALYVVFLVLTVLGMQRRLRMGGTLVVVSIMFLLLARTDWYDPGTKWLAAGLLNGVAAAMATRRLLYAPPPRDPARPWGPAFGGSDRAPGP